MLALLKKLFAAPTPAPVEAIVPPQPTAVPTAEPDLATQLAALRDRLNQQRQTDLRALKSNTAVAEDKSKAAMEFAQKTGLGKALLIVGEEMQYWPAWLKNGGMSRDTPERLGLTNVVAAEKEEGTKARISFTFEQKNYLVEVSASKVLYTTIHFHASGEEVLRIVVEYVNVASGVYEWQLRRVERIDVGSWMVALLELHHRVETKSNASLEKSLSKYAESISKDLPATATLRNAQGLPKEQN